MQSMMNYLNYTEMRLIEKMNQLRVKEGQIALFYLGQAGICIKTSDNKMIVVDAYLSDA